MISRVASPGWAATGPTPSADKSANLANSRGDAVVFAFFTPSAHGISSWRGRDSITADASGASLCREQADVVSGAEFSKCKENAIDNDKPTDHAGLGEVEVVASHNEADDSLQEDAEGQCVPRAQPVGGRGAKHGTWDVEQVDNCIPAEDGCEPGRVSIYGGQDGGGVYPERVGRKLGATRQGHRQATHIRATLTS